MTPCVSAWPFGHLSIRSARAFGRQSEAALRLGVSRGMLSEFELGQGGTPLDLALRVLTDLGRDVVLAPRDRAVSLRANPT